jgi:hypothetical protein
MARFPYFASQPKGSPHVQAKPHEFQQQTSAPIAAALADFGDHSGTYDLAGRGENMSFIHHLNRMRIHYRNVIAVFFFELALVCTAAIIGLKCANWIAQHWRIF